MEYRLNSNYNILCYIVRYNARMKKYEVSDMREENVNCETKVTERAVDPIKKLIDGKQMKIILPVAAIVLIAVALVLFLFTGPKNVNLKDYLNSSPEIRGLSGRATIDISELFDDSAFSRDLTDSLITTGSEELKNMSNEEMEVLFEKQAEIYSECEKAVKDITISIWKNGEEVSTLSELSNGDVIKVEASSKTPDNVFFDKKFKTGSIQFTVSGLTEGKSVDVFDNADFEIKYVGVDGSGSVVVNWDAAAMPDLKVEFNVKDNTYSYSNGDNVEIIVNYDKAAWEEKGYYPKEESRVYTVEDLNSYIKSVDEISDEQLTQLKALVEAALKNEAKREWVDGVSIENITYLGSYFLNRKESAEHFGPANMMYLVYKVDVLEDFTSNGGERNRISYYYYGAYEGVTATDKGVVDTDSIRLNTCKSTFSREVKTSSSAWFGQSYIYYYGYEKLNNLFSACVEDYMDQYSYVSTVEEVE